MSNRSFFRGIREFLHGQERVRVAVIGSKACGKTVFLTSLANHLKTPDEERCRLAGGWKVVCPPNRNDDLGKDFPGFPYAAARQSFTSGEWPVKTKDWSVLRIPLQLKKRKKCRRVLLEVLDLPGERVADFPMIGRSYGEWCKWMFGAFGGVDGLSVNFNRYATRLEKCGDFESAVRAYKDFLAEEYGDYALSLTPSVVKLGLNAESRGGAKEEFRQAIEKVAVGVDADHQFIPLPQACFEASSPKMAWAKSCAASYELYQKRVVGPICDWLGEVNQVFYFTDVLEVLKRGPRVYNSERSFGITALGYFRRYDSPNRVLKFARHFVQSLFKTDIDGAFVVATKADLVFGEGNRSRMVRLARQMLGVVLDDLGEGVVTDVLSCAAVRTTDEYGKEGALRALIRTRDQGDVLKNYQAVEIPASWPNDGEWDAKKFCGIPQTLPRFDERVDRAPANLGMAEVINRMFSLLVH